MYNFVAKLYGPKLCISRWQWRQKLQSLSREICFSFEI